MGLGYEKEEDEKLFKSSQSKVPTCIYCFKKGHSSEKKKLFKKKSKETEGEKVQKGY